MGSRAIAALSFGMARWVCLSLRPLPRAPSLLQTPWLSSPARVASPSLVAAIPWRLSRRLVLLRSTKLKSNHAGTRCVKCYVMGVQGAIVRGEPGLVHNKTADDRVGNTLRRLHVTPSLCDMSNT